jgi:hypothetical protein
MMSNVPTNRAAEWAVVERRALVTAGAGIAVCIIVAIFSWPHFVRAYLVAWNFWMAISLGSLVLLMTQYLTGGAWGLLLRRIFEAAAGNILMMGILFLVLLPGLPALYKWALPDVVAASEALRHKSGYLNPQAFWIRSAIYFVAWILLAWMLIVWSRRQDRGQRTVYLSERCQAVSGPGLVIYGITITLASVDWVMSLEPAWWSTIFPPLFAVGQMLAALAFGIIVLMCISAEPPPTVSVTSEQRRDLGSLLLAFVMVWAYLSFSQFMIIWSENLPEEIPWYVNRTRGGWQFVALSLVAFQFALPFLLLLMREAKTDARTLRRIAAVVLATCFIDLIWWVEAAYAQPVSLYVLVDVAALAAVGGIWTWLFARRLRNNPLLPVADPYLAEYLPEVAV